MGTLRKARPLQDEKAFGVVGADHGIPQSVDLFPDDALLRPSGGQFDAVVDLQQQQAFLEPKSVFSNAAFTFARSFLHLVALFGWRLPCLTAHRHDFQRGYRKNDTPTNFRRTAPMEQGLSAMIRYAWP